MKRLWAAVLAVGCLTLTGYCATNWTVVGWNNLGMHCMDNDFSVFSILPPYNTIHAQVVLATNATSFTRLATNVPGLSVTYEAVADPDGSFNSTSVGKANFWQYVNALFGLPLADDTGLPVPGPSYKMPGLANVPQAMTFETNSGWFAAYGIPITPYDDAQRKNAYPMMRLVARLNGSVLTNLDIVLPVSDEMDCRACHASGSGPAAKPIAGWTWDADPTRDYRLNILRFHDEWEANNVAYKSALAINGYNTAGMYATVVNNGRPILCAACHLSEALPGSGLPGIEALTRAVHRHHATVVDPTNGLTLDATGNRSACYRCHPGSETRCLRGAMGKAVGAGGAMLMQCQSCHGNMSAVGAANRTGWLNEPNCQSCHVGTATNSYGVIRFTDAYTNGQWRAAAEQTFATNPNTPMVGTSLYRFSRGHGGLYCEACHGSTHAEFPTSHRNDNITTRQLQKHDGVVVQCSRCHGSNRSTINGGPHGMHPVGQDWVKGGDTSVAKHYSVGSGNVGQCRACHGTDYLGTVLSLSQSNQTLTATSLDGTPNTVTRYAWRGYRIGCWTCHLGPTNKTGNPNTPPAAQNVAASTTVNTPVTFALTATDASPLTFRIISQPDNGAVSLTGSNATYYPATAFAVTDKFTYAAWDGQLDSNLATGTVTVAGGCVYALSPVSQTFSELGGAGSITVNVSGGCAWSATSEHRWLTILSVTGSQVFYRVDANTSALARNGALTVAGQNFPVAQNGTPVDANGDGLPDAWQTTYFGSAASPNAAPGPDPDGDGFTNLQEYRAGTAPNNPASAPQITSIVAAGAAFTVTFNTLPNKLYQVQRRDDLLTGGWLNFTNIILGTGNPVSVPDYDAPGQPKRFYRVRLVP